MKPIGVASDGYLCGNPISIVSNGYLCKITIEKVTIHSGGGMKTLKSITLRARQQWRRRGRDFDDRDIIKKVPNATKITVTCIIDGLEIVKTKTIKNVNIDISNVKISINENKKIRLDIIK